MKSFAKVFFWLREERASVGLTFAVSMPLLFAGVGAAVDIAHMVAEKTKLQAVADEAALAAARELRVANANASAVAQVAADYVKANTAGNKAIGIATSVADGNVAVVVNLNEAVPTYVMQLAGASSSEITAKAEARVLGGAPACLIGLDPASSGTVVVDKSKLTASGCSVYSDSRAPDGVRADNSGTIEATSICSAGGTEGAASGYTPTPQLDCPSAPDPLSSRPPPTVGACDHTNMVAAGGIRLLLPGVYCGGLAITKGAIATLTPGDYIIKDGPLLVDTSSVVTGLGVGFYLTGNNAIIDFEPSTTINLTAPIAGPLAGMLFFEDRNNAENTHKMLSRNAPLLLGTFYLPRSTLAVGAPGGPGLLSSLIGALSAWTIIIAQRVSINDGMHLKLNTNFSGTKVPVPEGLGPNGTKVVLSQ
ncbi:MAG: pilus assembly protein [Methylobacteriaceae bacterium]|nr:pilus assembly protein [Methylobacteriaceae bacterium]